VLFSPPSVSFVWILLVAVVATVAAVVLLLLGAADVSPSIVVMNLKLGVSGVLRPFLPDISHY